jgi:hypothetical protein
MKVTKSFHMTLAARYQSYSFGTTVEEEVITDGGVATIEEFDATANRLYELAVKNTLIDIETFAQADEDFQAVFLSRKEELDRYIATLKAKGKMSK